MNAFARILQRTFSGLDSNSWSVLQFQILLTLALWSLLTAQTAIAGVHYGRHSGWIAPLEGESMYPRAVLAHVILVHSAAQPKMSNNDI